MAQHRLLLRILAGLILVAAFLAPALLTGQGRRLRRPPSPPVEDRELTSLRLAINDLITTFGSRYSDGPRFLARLDELEKAPDRRRVGQQIRELRQRALLANPLLDFNRLLLVRRGYMNGRKIGFPSNHECNSSLVRSGYDDSIAILSPIRPDGTLTTLYRPPDRGYVGEIELHWSGDRLLFTRSDSTNWKLFEIDTTGNGLRQVSQAPADVDCFDACYLPNGQIIFGSTASFQSVPCWHGQKKVSNLYVMNADGSGMRQLCFDQDHNFHPCVLNDGQVIYHRWDYTGINHIFMRQLMVMNPDGTGQRAIYGSNSWYPNSLYFPRPIPGAPGKLICILSGYHGVYRMGQLVILDTGLDGYGAGGLVQRISGRGDPIRPQISDVLVDRDWPKFVHPYPLSDKYFLVSCWQNQKSRWGIYLADVFDNLVLVREEPGYALLEPVPIQKTVRPPVLPDRRERGRKDAVVYLHDVHAGPGLAGVPRGTIVSLRVFSYHFGYLGLAGPDKIGYGGPWEVMRILGTVPLEKDGSAVFSVPANTPLGVQALDEEGKAVQLMRSWFTLMPGEHMSCEGCHERVHDAPRPQFARAAQLDPRDIEPWYGPARGFDFSREVQPVLDAYCVECHDGKPGPDGVVTLDLRAEEKVGDYRGQPITKLGKDRLHPKMMKATGGVIKYTPAYDALLPYIRRVSIEDDVSMLVPGEYHADTSELIQMLKKGHGGVRLDRESWDRLITWIDLNAPCHGTWGDVHPYPDDAHERRLALSRLYGGPGEDPEAIPALPRPQLGPVERQPEPENGVTTLAGWPLDAASARKRQLASGSHEKTIELGEGIVMKLRRIPAGDFIMGSTTGQPDERPRAHVKVTQDFWMGVFEVTNEQLKRFDPDFDCRYYGKLHGRADDQGLPLNGSKQPAVRVSWKQAMAFCRWLSKRAGMRFSLPTEAQWEYACRVGSETALSFGSTATDFSAWANVGDRAYGALKIVTGGVHHIDPQGRALCDGRHDDGSPVTAAVGSYRPNAWGLYDMHGNAAEWTRSTYRPYPYREDGRNEPTSGDRKVVRGGSFFDRPDRCRSALRLDFPSWQRVFNVGFRVVAELQGSAGKKKVARTSRP